MKWVLGKYKTIIFSINQFDAILSSQSHTVVNYHSLKVSLSLESQWILASVNLGSLETRTKFLQLDSEESSSMRLFQIKGSHSRSCLCNINVLYLHWTYRISMSIFKVLRKLYSKEILFTFVACNVSQTHLIVEPLSCLIYKISQN